MKNLVVFGTGQFADVAWYYLTHFSSHSIAAYTVEEEYLDLDEFRGRPVVPFEEVEKHYPPTQYGILPFVSYRGCNRMRERILRTSINKGYWLPSFVFPGLPHSIDIGKGCFIMEENTVQPFVTIGDGVILWSNNHVGHHTSIGDYCFIASEVCISGSVQIGRRCFFGVNSTIRDNIVIGDDCIIGAGANVTDDLPAGSVIVPPRSKILDRRSHEVEI